jgi:lysozyme family protein
MTTNELIDGILEREGEGTPPYLAPNDKGGRTSWGISERSHPEAWVNGPPSRDAAGGIYFGVYFMPFSKLWYGGLDARIVACLVDDAVMRGVGDSIKRFQWVLHETMDGVVGPKTTLAAVSWPSEKLLKAYVTERCVRLCRVVEHDPTQATNITGWITRVLTFLP